MLRAAAEVDREMMRHWRNHPSVRGVSFTTHEISVEEHRRWWDTVQADPARRVLIYERDGSPCGVVNFFDHEPESRSAMWGIYLDSAGLGRSGELLGSWWDCEREAIDYAFGPMDLLVLRAEALVENTAVRWLHRRYGFAESPGEDRVLDGVVKPTVTVELTRERAMDTGRAMDPGRAMDSSGTSGTSGTSRR